MKKRLFPIAIAIAVTALFVLPGLAFGGGGGGGKGTPSPPPSNPPCDSDGHNNQPPPYGGPNKNSGSCDHGHQTTGNPTTGNPTTGNPTTGNPTTGNPTTGNPTTGTATTGGATLNQCEWNVTLGGMTIIPGSDVPNVVGVHVDVPPDPATHTTGSLAHACVGVGSVVTPSGGGRCPAGTAPIEVQTDQSSFVLVCALL
jgi:hypothetical protein